MLYRSWWIGLGALAACVDPGNGDVLAPVHHDPDQADNDPVIEEPVDEVPTPVEEGPTLLGRPLEPVAARDHARAEADGFVTQAEDARAHVASLRVVGGCGSGSAAWRGSWHASLQDALNATGADPVLLVCPGTYAGTFTAHAGDAVVIAPWVPGTVELVGGAGSALVSDASLLALVDLTFSESGESAVAARGELFAVIGSRFHRNNDSGTGGALDVSATTALIAGSTFTENWSDYGGGAALVVAPWIAVVDSRFEDNAADYEAGAMEARHANFATTGGLLLTAGNHFVRNHAGYEGGALVTGIRWTPLWGASLYDTFEDNTADYAGGAIQSSPGGGRYDVIGSSFSGGGAGREGSVLDFGGWSTFDSMLVDVRVEDAPSAPVLLSYQGDALLPATVTFVRGEFVRNGGAQVIAARRSWKPELPVRVTGDDVFFGSGTDANAGRAVNACGATQGTLDFAFGGGQATVCP